MTFFAFAWNSTKCLPCKRGKSPKHLQRIMFWKRTVTALQLLFLILCLILTGCKDETADSSATINWTAPTTRIDGTPLPMSEIAGYKIYIRDSTNILISVIEINDAYIMEYQHSSQTSGTYSFSVTAFDQNQVESDFSEAVSKTFE